MAIQFKLVKFMSDLLHMERLRQRVPGWQAMDGVQVAGTLSGISGPQEARALQRKHYKGRAIHIPLKTAVDPLVLPNTPGLRAVYARMIGFSH
jgi:hypothetical protein